MMYVKEHRILYWDSLTIHRLFKQSHLCSSHLNYFELIISSELELNIWEELKYVQQHQTSIGGIFSK